MKVSAFAVMCLVCIMGAPTLQAQDRTSVPREIGNRANGFSYQPTPGQVVTREVLAGVRPSKTKLEATDQILEGIDRSLLRDEGLSETSVPAFTPNR
jgi:hypothetical protein